MQDKASSTDKFLTIDSVIYYRKPRKYYEGLAETLAKTLGLRDPNLAVHSLEVANFATKLARQLGLSEEQVDLIRRGSLLHDIGKLGVPQDILSKPAVLSEKEYEKVKIHPVLGATLLQECVEYQTLIPMVLHHHEFFNGKGYPSNIDGDKIAVEVRIVSVAEAVTSMATDRPYRKAISTKEIISELHRCAGTQFDPNVVGAGIQVLRKDGKAIF